MKRLHLGIQARASGGQWEDDLNTLRLRPYFTIDVSGSYKLSRNFEIFAAAENMFNNRFEIGRTPVLTVSPPAFVRVGLRVSLGGR